MNKKLTLGVIVALLAALATVPLAFAGDGGSDRHRKGEVRFIRVTTQTLQQATVDAPPPGDSLGDRFVFSDNVFRDGTRVGTDGGDCVLVLFKPGPDPKGPPETFTVQCVVTVSLPEGTITVQGLIDFASRAPATLAVTGGTGEFRTARGEAEVTNATEDVTQVLFRLILDDHNNRHHNNDNNH